MWPKRKKVKELNKQQKALVKEMSQLYSDIIQSRPGPQSIGRINKEWERSEDIGDIKRKLGIYYNEHDESN